MSVGEKVRLRAPERGDLEKYRQWVNRREVWQYLGDGPMFMSPENEEEWFEKTIKDPNQRLLSVETIDGILIGNCSLMGIDWLSRSAELAITIGESEYWGKGYGGDTIKLLLDLAFNQYNLHRVYLHVLDNNIRGRRCYAKCGFREEGVLRESAYLHGEYRDFVIMGILEDEYRQGLGDTS